MSQFEIHDPTAAIGRTDELPSVQFLKDGLLTTWSYIGGVLGILLMILFVLYHWNHCKTGHEVQLVVLSEKNK